jgi:hypothetical protein
MVVSVEASFVEHTSSSFSLHPHNYYPNVFVFLLQRLTSLVLGRHVKISRESTPMAGVSKALMVVSW